MKHIFVFAISSSVIVGLSACGGSSTSSPPPVLLPVKTVSGTTPTAYDPAAGTLVLNGAAVTNPRLTEVVSNGEASVFSNVGLTTYSAIAQNNDVFALATAEDAGGTDLRGFTYGRRVTTELPTIGSATYSGDYAGMFMEDAGGTGQNIFATVDGDVAMAVDLAGKTFTGSITNRQAYNVSGIAAPASTSFADAMITGGTIAADRTFSATVTGGERTYSGGTYTTTAGSTIGVFGGATGNAVAGVVTINQAFPDAGAAPNSEIGSFIASQD